MSLWGRSMEHALSLGGILEMSGWGREREMLKNSHNLIVVMAH